MLAHDLLTHNLLADKSQHYSIEELRVKIATLRDLLQTKSVYVVDEHPDVRHSIAKLLSEFKFDRVSSGASINCQSLEAPNLLITSASSLYKSDENAGLLASNRSCKMLTKVIVLNDSDRGIDTAILNQLQIKHNNIAIISHPATIHDIVDALEAIEQVA